MKIYTATLWLINDMEGKYYTKFIFELADGDYKVNGKYNEWTSVGKGWLTDKIPMSMIYEYSIGLPKVIQGFDHELTKDELIRLEQNMKNFMINGLEEEKDEFLKIYDKKVKAISFK
ncbi:hypothetical protein FDF74_11430 [Clostridium niameyense]|uniref:Uncharacterized protein n=1 Tax=Clostridium niameyense TaxID=1622073 RepID=A0A6M0RC87_9CLOT|nr:hypothetical protein [Clostridium niameyense]NEZ47792.1 hypothetical protein [Clostridium niameyense]